MSDVETVPAVEVPDEARLLDVREAYEFRAGRAPGALHMPVEEVPERFEAELDPDEDYFVICRTGGRSIQMAGWLTQQGYSVLFVAGGYDAWVTSGRALESDDGQPRIL
ncbi:rhodanese-like domain-containing protein [Nesterenkonia sp. NBAIMH1]|uniref:rhodanese-like domain-containing protein n=1 Tax=Nesterenkonia sp. NBAIMH1 TaxID=2600320 RepID=UPI0011B5219D|nr:rhodanese-like domain-containing protein [Nesterenkonia sp. NBAIMH1]